MNKAIELKQISKRYPYLKPCVKNEGSDNNGLWALRGVSLDFEQGKILGIIGRNGAGKTTLLNIITGVLSPSDGEVIAKGKILGLFNLGVGFQDELTGKENIFLNAALLGATKGEINNKLNSIIDFSELGDFINMPLGSYSQGMRLRLGFSIVANLDFDILAIDEVLAVGDALFQNKCFQRLMDFKRSGKTLILSTQSMELVERLCDRAALLDHGKLLFCGEAIEAINKYRALLNTEKFFVGPENKNLGIVENTKKWADNVSDWGEKFGTKEVEIETVEFRNKFGLKFNSIKSNAALKIKVNFKAQNNLQGTHFGVAIFRRDGVYCYGPNTKFDGYKIKKINPGKGYFSIKYKKLSLAPGEYVVSVAIWDKNEVVPFDHHYGYYKLTVSGDDIQGINLLNIPFKLGPWQRPVSLGYDLNFLKNAWGKRIENKEMALRSAQFLDSKGKAKDNFMTNECAKFTFSFFKEVFFNKNSYFWFGIYRDDGVCCQTIMLSALNKKSFAINFSRLALLPGGYKISFGVWDCAQDKFLMLDHGIYPLKMVSYQQDHGTIYLEHSWKWR